MIGIIIADYDEIQWSHLKKIIKLRKIEINGFCFFLLKVCNKRIPLCLSGIGKTNAAAATIAMIDNFKINAIFNLGLCGINKSTIKISCPIIAKSVEYFDVDLTNFGYKKNQIPHEKTKILIKKKYIKKLSTLLNDNNEKPIIESIVSGDSLVTKKILILFPIWKIKLWELIWNWWPSHKYVKKNKIDIFSLKFVSDFVLAYKQHSTYQTSLKELQKKITTFLIKFLYSND